MNAEISLSGIEVTESLLVYSSVAKYPVDVKILRPTGINLTGYADDGSPSAGKSNQLWGGSSFSMIVTLT